MGNITKAENTWCPGCGNFAIMNAFSQAVDSLNKDGVKKENILITAGIGCHGKIFDYLDLSGIYSLHGRAAATAQGMKLGNPDMNIVAFAGDGDSFGEGLGHVLFAAKRNFDMTLIVHYNSVYGLTTGQFTPVSEKGFVGPSTPQGSIEEPFNVLALMLRAKAPFIAQGYSGNIKQLKSLIEEAVKYRGFSFINVLQPCVSFYDTYKLYNDKTFKLESATDDFTEALKIMEHNDKIPTGLIYRTTRPVYHEELYGENHNPFLDKITLTERRKIIDDILK